MGGTLAGMRRALLALIFCCSLGSASADFSVPFAGWTANGPDSWQSAGGHCVIKEELHDQPFAALPDLPHASALAARLQGSLTARKFEQVVVDPIERGGSFGLLASYLLSSGGSYRITQLYLSEGGRLRTLTGSALDDETDKCAADIQNYLRYLAY